MANSPIQGIDNIGICVTDLAQSVRFYQHLGFEVLFEGDRGVTVALGTAKLFLFPAQPGDERAVGRRPGLFGNPPGIDHISFLVDDVDALHASLTANGVAAGPQPADQDWGARAFGLLDPDGNNLYFLRWLLPGASRPGENHWDADQSAPHSERVDVKYGDGDHNEACLRGRTKTQVALRNGLSVSLRPRLAESTAAG